MALTGARIQLLERHIEVDFLGGDLAFGFRGGCGQVVEQRLGGGCGEEVREGRGGAEVVGEQLLRVRLEAVAAATSSATALPVRHTLLQAALAVLVEQRALLG